MDDSTENSGDVRAFIAIDIADDARKALGDFIDSLKRSGADVKWARADAIHITLKFLGDVSCLMIPKIKAAMEAAAAGVAPFELSVEGAGAFPNLRKPRVLWTGVIDPTGSTTRLAERVDNETARLGFNKEDRAFKPHLTIGRVREGGSVGAIADKIAAEKRNFGAFAVTSIDLMKSDLKPTGAVYTKLESVALKG